MVKCPQDKFRFSACFELPLRVFDLLFTALKPEERFIDEQLLISGFDNFILISEGSRRACFYAYHATETVIDDLENFELGEK